MIHVTVDGAKDLIEKFNKFERASSKATAASMNQAGTHAVSQSLKNVTNKYTFLQKDFRKSMKINRATMSSLVYQMRISTLPIPLARFSARDRRKRGLGVSFKLLKGGKRGVLPKAFMASNARGTHVLMRTTEARYPLIPFASITPTSAFLNTGSDSVFIEAFMRQFDKRYPINLRHFGGFK
jgi:hypothetical protein